MSIFGWSYPPGCTGRDIDNAFSDGPLDCPICADGVELDGPDCPTDTKHGVTCPKHGCIVCGDLERHRLSCHYCAAALNPEGPFLLDGGITYCGPECRDLLRQYSEEQRREKEERQS